jgi:succinate-acetate transporter protein
LVSSVTLVTSGLPLTTLLANVLSSRLYHQSVIKSTASCALYTGAAEVTQSMTDIHTINDKPK